MGDGGAAAGSPPGVDIGIVTSAVHGKHGPTPPARRVIEDKLEFPPVPAGLRKALCLFV